MAKKLKCSVNEIIDFASNTNFYQPDVTLALTADAMVKYADPSHTTLKNALGENYSLEANQIALFTTTTSAIENLFGSLKQKKVYLYTPLLTKYEKIALAQKKHIYRINRISSLEEEPLEKSIVVFVNPSIPDGTYYEEIEELFTNWMELECTIILDESFLEFEGLKSMRDKINAYKKLYIVHSFSKFYGFSGVNVTAVFSNKTNIKRLTDKLHEISSLDIALLQSRVQDEAFKRTSIALYQEQKAQLNAVLEESKLFDEIVASDTNYILTRSQRAKEILAKLLQNKIVVRKCGSFEYLSNDWLRFTVKDASSQEALKEALHDI